MIGMGRRAHLGWAVAVLAAGCAHHRAPAAFPAGAMSEAILEPEVMRQGRAVQLAWIAYVVAKSATYDRQPPPAANQSGDDFTLELAARQAQSEVWEEQRHQGAPASLDLDRQVEIWRAGFLPELVLLLYGRPGWTVPAAAVQSLRLQDFARRFGGTYHAWAPAALRPASGKLHPDVPGADFPAAEDLPLSPGSCGMDDGAAWKRWEAVRSKLGGAPVSAQSSIGFAQQVMAIRRDPRFTGKALTWVSERVAYLAFFDGFCASLARDWPAAIAALERASALDPGNGQQRLELAQALSAAGRRPEALAEVDRVLAVDDNPCDVALGWRRRGYILFEMGQLLDARAAYQTSLTFEPDSAVAQDELTTIAELLARQGESIPPTPPALSATSCRDGKSVSGP
jgi:tetratricopeptide (TPR) repeat protein